MYDTNVIKTKVKLSPFISSIEEAEPVSVPETKDPKVLKNITLEKVKPGTEFKGLDVNASIDADTGD